MNERLTLWFAPRLAPIGPGAGSDPEFPTVTMVEPTADAPDAEASIDLPLLAWRAGRIDLADLDRRVDDLGEKGLAPTAAAGQPPERTELLTRCQRWLDRRNRHSQTRAFEAVLALHGRLHDRARPSARGHANHAFDTWQWLLRLEPEAGLAVQIAALFHDVERVLLDDERVSEAEVEDYPAYKRSHADRGAFLARDLLPSAGVEPDLIERVAELIVASDRPLEQRSDSDTEVTLLEDADALSFFSLCSTGYFDAYGAPTTARKIAWTTGRLSLRACARLPGVRLRRDLEDLVRAAIGP